MGDIRRKPGKGQKVSVLKVEHLCPSDHRGSSADLENHWEDHTQMFMHVTEHHNGNFVNLVLSATDHVRSHS
jgi:hypothetical protein